MDLHNDSDSSDNSSDDDKLEEHIITLVGLIHLQFGRPLGSILPFTINSIFSFVCRTILSNPIHSIGKKSDKWVVCKAAPTALQSMAVYAL